MNKNNRKQHSAVKRMKNITTILIVITSMVFMSCVSKSQVTFELSNDLKLPFGETTIVLTNHNGDPANVYTRTTDTNTLTFIDFPYGTYAVKITSQGIGEYNYQSLTVKSSRMSHKATIISDVGAVVRFEGREWRLLEKQENKALFISQRIIGERRFDGNSNVWANSEIRRYLNGEFYNSLSDETKSRIVDHTTADKVFLLSVDEARRYFRSDSDRVARNSQGQASWWWLRSPGLNTYGACYVNSAGYINLIGRSVDYTSGGVRPALWLNL